jgi:queuosine precursor transporter
MTRAIAIYAAFIATIPAANWWLDRYGFWDVPGIGMVASGVIFAGLAFVLRDVAQLLTNRYWTLTAIACGIALSYWLADPFIATASAAAFGVSESLDLAVYTPLADRRFLLAVVLSSLVGAFVDSALFLYLAFDSADGWWQLAVVKSVVIAMAVPFAWRARRAVSVRLRPAVH